MTSQAWKDFEKRVCRKLGAKRRLSIGEGGWARGTDDDGSCYFAVETKRSKRRVPEGRWIEQARRNGKVDGRPWLLVVAGHNDRRPIAVLDFNLLVELGQKAGVLEEVE